MLNKYKAKREEGFTIIEVLIVLAIAGLIMVIVFIAVPQLQRNQRNEARNNDARLLANAVGDCMSNRNGVVASCSVLGGNGVIAPDNRNQLTDNPSYGNGTGSTTQAIWAFGLKCSDDGTGTETATPREFVVRYQVESSSADQPRCISS